MGCRLMRRAVKWHQKTSVESERKTGSETSHLQKLPNDCNDRLLIFVEMDDNIA